MAERSTQEMVPLHWEGSMDLIVEQSKLQGENHEKWKNVLAQLKPSLRRQVLGLRGLIETSNSSEKKACLEKWYAVGQLVNKLQTVTRLTQKEIARILHLKYQIVNRSPVLVKYMDEISGLKVEF